MSQATAIDGSAATFTRTRRGWGFGRWLLHKKIAFLCVTYLSVFYLAGVVGPFVAPYDQGQQQLTVEARNAPPSADHIFGTDGLGRDLFSRVLSAARTTIIFTVLTIITGEIFLGIGLGLLAGYRGGWIDAAIMRTGEVLSAVPPLILMLAIASAFRPQINDTAFWLQDHTFLGEDARLWVKFAIVIGVVVPFSWIGTSRIIRGQVLAMREQDFILSAEALGASTSRIIWRHIFPGVLPLFVVGMSSAMAGIAGSEVALSYLGFGVDAPYASFGGLIGQAGGVVQIRDHPYLMLFSAGPVILFFYAWNLLGDALVDYFEPRARRN